MLKNLFLFFLLFIIIVIVNRVLYWSLYVLLFIFLGLFMVCGFFVNGFYVLIITVVSVDLGIYEVLKGNFKVLFIVIVIIDGIGSIG